MLNNWRVRAGLLLLSAAIARGDVTLLLEEPYGTFGGMNPTGHAAVYFSRICADTPLSLRRCQPGELGAVISRYHRVGGYDWIAIPLVAYLYAVEQAEQVPDSATTEEVASLRDGYRRGHLEELAPDDNGGITPVGDWTQLVGEAYDRTIYGFKIQTTQMQDDAVMQALNSRPNRNHFNLLFHNCADFARQLIDSYYPGAVGRNFTADLGIMTPKQAAKALVHYSRRHPELELSAFVIRQVPGTVPRSAPVRGVLESLIKSKRYVVPLASLAVLHPLVGGGLAYALLEGSHFNPRREAASDGGAFALEPEGLAAELRTTGKPAALRSSRSPADDRMQEELELSLH